MLIGYIVSQLHTLTNGLACTCGCLVYIYIYLYVQLRVTVFRILRWDPNPAIGDPDPIRIRARCEPDT